MLRDKNLTLRDIQIILGHAHLSTTQLYLEEDPEDVIRRVHEHLRRPAVDEPPTSTTPAPPTGRAYNAADLAVLFGDQPR
jgi:hypothetical protein